MYKSFKKKKLPNLGMGTMRLPTVADGEKVTIDEEAVEEMIAYALEQGVNYFDTAWGYHSGNSEVVIGKILGKYPRSSWYLADKFPGYDLSNLTKVEEIFEEQLERCNVEYFDFYLLHNLCELNADAYLDKKTGILDYLLRQREAGRIRHIGFSSHGGYDTVKRFLESCGSHMEFCMIQLNYLDWTFQNANMLVELLSKRGIPIWAMEPLRGGNLVALPDNETAMLKKLRPDETNAAWAFRFLQTIPGVTIVLSGVTTLEQLQENIKTFSAKKPLDTREFDTLLGIAERIVKQHVIPCTACRYCIEYCPKELDIPYLLELYNEHCYTDNTGGEAFIASMALSALPESRRPGSCTGCESCHAVCPQNIKISTVMEDITKRIEG